MLSVLKPPRLLPPSGHPIKFSVLFDSLLQVFLTGNNRSDEIEKILEDYLTVKHCYFVSSGTAALTLILKGLQQANGKKKEVIVPAYCCPSVATAILQSGLKPILCDIESDSFSFLPSQLKQKISDDTLAILLVHLFGFPWNQPDESVYQEAKKQNIFIVEDAAQGFGNRYPQHKEKMIGTESDVGFFSFGRGKPLSAGAGGIVVTNSSEIATYIDKEFLNVPSAGWRDLVKYFCIITALTVLFNRYFFWMPAKVPMLHLGETRFRENCKIHRGVRLNRNVLQQLLSLEESHKELRIKHVALLLDHLPPAHADTSFLTKYPYNRFPLMFTCRKLREISCLKLDRMGISWRFYPAPLNEITGLDVILNDNTRYENALRATERLVTLPVHAGVNEKDLIAISHAI